MIGLEKMILILKRFWVPILTVSTPIFWTWIFALDDTRSNGVSPSHAMRCLYVLCIMATYWMTSVFPLAITSLIPVAIFPLFGILSTVRFKMNKSSHSIILECLFANTFEN